jgi:hypothetical protein
MYAIVLVVKVAECHRCVIMPAKAINKDSPPTHSNALAAKIIASAIGASKLLFLSLKLVISKGLGVNVIIIYFSFLVLTLIQYYFLDFLLANSLLLQAYIYDLLSLFVLFWLRQHSCECF